MSDTTSLDADAERDRVCAVMEARLLGEERAQEDPALAAHLGSCLRCFRVAHELRDLPRLEGVLRASQLHDDPGESFWANFPVRVADAWQASEALEHDLAARFEVVAPRGRVREVAPPARWQRLVSWFRQPVPAALTGAACAGAMVFFLHQHPRALPPTAGPSTPEAAAVARSADESHLDREEEIAEDFVHMLDASGLELLLEPRATAAAFEGEEEVAPGLEDLEPLDEAELKTVSEKLGRQI